MTKTRKRSLGLLALVVIIGAACAWLWYKPAYSLPGSDEEQAYDRMQRKGQWEQIVARYQKQPPRSLACRKVTVLAQYRLGQIPQASVYECLANSREVLSSPMAAMMMSDVYIQLGMVNMAQRAAFEAMVKETDVKNCERSLHRLTETAIVTGQYELALKYIAILEKNFRDSDWLRLMRRLAEQPETIREEPNLLQLRKTYEESEDQFFM